MPDLPDWGMLPEFRNGTRVRSQARNWDEFDVEKGPPLITKISTAEERPFSAECLCQPPEVADEIDDFFRIQCNEGSTFFTKDGQRFRWREPPSRKDDIMYSVVSISLWQQPS